MRAPQQSRSKDSLERVLAAATDLLRETGYEGLSIAEVCARANVSVESIYARFKSKATLFAALQTRALKEIDREQDALFRDLPEPSASDAQIVERAARLVADHILHHEEILRGAVDAGARQRGPVSSLRLAEHFEAHLLGSIDRFAGADRERAVDVAFRILTPRSRGA